MLDSLEDISHFQSVFVQFEDQYLLECKSNLRLQMVISEQKHELEKLNILVENLKEGI
jgi:hypothetical protein